MYKPIIGRPKLCPPDQAIIKQTQRVPWHERDTLTPYRLATCLDALDQRGIGLLVRCFDIGPRHFGVACNVADGPFGNVRWEKC